MINNKLKFYTEKCEKLRVENKRLLTIIEEIEEKSIKCFITEKELDLFYNECDFNIEINNPKIIDQDIPVMIYINKLKESNDKDMLPMEGLNG